MLFAEKVVQPSNTGLYSVTRMPVFNVVEEELPGARDALLVHGLFADAGSWARVAAALADRGLGAVMPELAGHGASPRASSYTPKEWADDLVNAVGGRRFEVAIGHSLGGLVLSLAAGRLQAARLVLLDPTWHMSAEQHRRFGALWHEQLGWDRARWQAQYPSWAAEDLEARVRSAPRMDPACIDGLAPGGGHDYRPQHPTARTLIVAADPSEFVPAGEQSRLREASFVVAVPSGLGHAAFREDLPAFLRTVEPWLVDD